MGMKSVLSYLRCSHMMKCLQNDEEQGILKILDSLQAAKGIIKLLCDKRNIDLNNFIGETSEIIISKVCPMIENVVLTPTVKSEEMKTDEKAKDNNFSYETSKVTKDKDASYDTFFDLQG